MQGIQLLLTAVVVTLTFLLIFVGVQVVFLLREVRTVVKRVNEVLEDAHPSALFTERKVPQISIQNFLSHLFSQSKGFGIEPMEPENDKSGIYTTTPEESSDDVVSSSLGDQFVHITQLQERGRRVFYRKGKPLA